MSHLAAARSRSVRQSIRSAMLTGALFLLGPAPAGAVERIQVLGPTAWVTGNSELTLDRQSGQQPALRITASQPSDRYIYSTVPFTFGATLKAVIVCYRTPDAGTFISQVRLTETILPIPAFVRRDDPTDLFSETGTCYRTDFELTPTGSVMLNLRLVFNKAGDEIFVGAVGVLMDEP